MELFGHLKRRRLLDGRSLQGHRCSAVKRRDGVHGAAFPAVGARLGGARIQHHVAIGAAESLGARARVSVRSSALARPTVQARFVRSAVVEIWKSEKRSI